MDRHFLGDVALAVLLALPTATFVRPVLWHSSASGASPTQVQSAPTSVRSPLDRRSSLLG